MPRVNITPNSSAKGLRSKLQSEAINRGLNTGTFLSKTYGWAVENRDRFTLPLKHAVARGGDHIGAEVAERTAAALTQWAKSRETPRGKLCCFLLEKVIEDKLLAEIFDEE